MRGQRHREIREALQESAAAVSRLKAAFRVQERTYAKTQHHRCAVNQRKSVLAGQRDRLKSYCRNALRHS